MKCRAQSGRKDAGAMGDGRIQAKGQRLKDEGGRSRSYPLAVLSSLGSGRDVERRARSGERETKAHKRVRMVFPTLSMKGGRRRILNKERPKATERRGLK